MNRDETFLVHARTLNRRLYPEVNMTEEEKLEYWRAQFEMPGWRQA